MAILCLQEGRPKGRSNSENRCVCLFVCQIKWQEAVPTSNSTHEWPGVSMRLHVDSSSRNEAAEWPSFAIKKETRTRKVKQTDRRVLHRECDEFQWILPHLTLRTAYSSRVCAIIGCVQSCSATSKDQRRSRLVLENCFLMINAHIHLYLSTVHSEREYARVCECVGTFFETR